MPVVPRLAVLVLSLSAILVVLAALHDNPAAARTDGPMPAPHRRGGPWLAEAASRRRPADR